MKLIPEIEKQRQANLARHAKRTTNVRAEEAAATVRMRHTWQTLLDLGAGTLTDNPDLAAHHPEITSTIGTFNKVFRHWLADRVRKPLLPNPEMMRASPEEIARREAEFRRLHPNAYLDVPTDIPPPKAKAQTKDDELGELTQEINEMMDSIKLPKPTPRSVEGAQQPIDLMAALHLKKKRVYTEAEKQALVAEGKAFINDEGELIEYQGAQL